MGPFGVVVALAAAAVSGALLSLIARRLLLRLGAGRDGRDAECGPDGRVPAGGPDGRDNIGKPGGGLPSGGATDRRT